MVLCSRVCFWIVVCAVILVAGAQSYHQDFDDEDNEYIQPHRRHGGYREDSSEHSQGASSEKAEPIPDGEEEVILEEQIRMILQHLRNQSQARARGEAVSGGLPGVEIPDPMTIPDFESHVEQTYTTAHVQLRDVSIEGLSDFLMDKISTSLGRLEVTIGLNISTIRVAGNYHLRGKASWFKLAGDGKFSMNITDAYVTSLVHLNVTDEGAFQVQQVEMDVKVKDIQLHFENLGGGKFLSGVINSMLNAMSKMMFENVKPSILQELEQTVHAKLNEQFETLPLQPFLVDAASPLDFAIANSAMQIRDRGLDPLSLPSQTNAIKKKLLFVTVDGQLKLFKGYLKGLSTITRTGDVVLIYRGNKLEVSAQLGFQELEGGYKWNAQAFGITRNGGLYFKVKDISVSIVIEQENVPGHHPRIQSLEIQHIGRMSVDVDGLGSLDQILEFMANFVGNVFKSQLSNILETQVKGVIQENLQEITLPF